jgi:hypothetical protein
MGGLKKDMMDLRCIKRTWWIGGHQMEHGGLVGIKRIHPQKQLNSQRFRAVLRMVQSFPFSQHPEELLLTSDERIGCPTQRCYLP